MTRSNRPDRDQDEGKKDKANGWLMHKLVCLGPRAAYDERCSTCGCTTVGHADFVHPGVGQYRTGLCTGRNNAGACRRCPGCARFAPAAKAAPDQIPAVRRTRRAG